jgi:hypothetical protein
MLWGDTYPASSYCKRGSLRKGNEGDVLTVKQAKELITSLQQEFLKPNAEADVEFLASADIVVPCWNLLKQVYQILRTVNWSLA